MTILSITWADAGGIAGALSVFGVIAMLLIRASLSDKFASTAAHTQLEETVQTFTADVAKMRELMEGWFSVLERRLGEVPDGKDFQRMSERLGAVEVTLAVSRESISHVKEVLSGVARNVDLLVRHQMGEGK